MWKTKKNTKKFVSNNIHTEAMAGMNEISNLVENYETDNYGGQMNDDYDTAEDMYINNDLDSFEENALRSGYKPTQARQVAQRTAANKWGSNRVNAAISRRMTRVGVTKNDTITGNKTAQLLPLLVTRGSYNIPGVNLPFIMFSPVSLQEEYRSILNVTNAIPPTVVLVSVLPVLGNIVFTYADKATGLLIDKVTIQSGNQVPYATILEMMKTDFFEAKGMKFTADSNNFSLQFSASPFNGGKQTMWGVEVGKSEPISAYKTVNQNQPDIINVDTTIRIDKESYLGLAMASSSGSVATTSQIKLDFFVTDYVRRTYGNTLG